MERIASISDVDGDRTALEAVLADIGAPEYAGYEADLRLVIYRGALADDAAGGSTLDSYYHLPRG